MPINIPEKFRILGMEEDEAFSRRPGSSGSSQCGSEGAENHDEMEEGYGMEEVEEAVACTSAVVMDHAFVKALRDLDLEREEEGFVDFMVIDIQVQQDKTHGTCVVLFGRCADGRSLHLTLHGWYPSMYVEAPEGWIDSPANHECVCLAMREALASVLEGDKALQKLLYTEPFHMPIVSMELVVGTDIMGFRPTKAGQLFLKQRVISPRFMKPLRECWEGGYRINEDTFMKEGHAIRISAGGIPEVVAGARKTPTFNSNLDPILQFMVDKELHGCQWCRVALPSSSISCEQQRFCDLQVVCLILRYTMHDVDVTSTSGARVSCGSVASVEPGGEIGSWASTNPLLRFRGGRTARRIP